MFLTPMLAAPIDEVPSDPAFVMEPKYDGWRAICSVTDGGACLYTRTGNPITSVPYLVRDLCSAFAAGSVLDAEIVDLASKRQWNRVQTLCSRNAVHAPTPESPALTLVIFDAIQLAGEDLKDLPLVERKRQLSAAWDAGRPSRAVALADGRFTLEFVAHEPADPNRAGELIAQGFEGVVVKDLNSRYVPGARNGGWFKIKPQAEIEAVCTGTFAGDGRLADARWVGGLTFQLDNGHAGRVGTGFSDEQRREIAAHPKDYVGKVIELLHHGIGEQGALRHPVFRRVRSDLEKPGPRPAEEAQTATATPRRARSTMSSSSAASATSWMRNYGAMGDAKLAAAVKQLRARAGDAYDRCVARDGDATTHLERAESVARSRGLM